jgi:hypothetical protein
VVVNVYNSSTWEAKAGGSKSRANLGYKVKPCLKKIKQKPNKQKGGLCAQVGILSQQPPPCLSISVGQSLSTLLTKPGTVILDSVLSLLLNHELTLIQPPSSSSHDFTLSILPQCNLGPHPLLHFHSGSVYFIQTLIKSG